jgi:hypothetical protein
MRLVRAKPDTVFALYEPAFNVAWAAVLPLVAS